MKAVQSQAKKMKCIFVSQHYSAGQKHTMETSNKSFKNMAKLNYLGTRPNQNFIHENIKSRLSQRMLALLNSECCLKNIYIYILVQFNSSQGQEIFLFFQTSRWHLGPAHHPIQWVLGALSPQAQSSTPPNAKVKNKWCYTSLPYAFHSMYRDNFTALYF